MNWSHIKNQLQNAEKKELINLVRDLYGLDKKVKDFLHTRFSDDGAEALTQDYKKMIEQAMPSTWPACQKFSISKGKSVITRYRKATRDIYGECELMFHFIVCGNNYTLEFGDIDESFYTSMENMFEALITKLKSHESLPLMEKYYQELKNEHFRIREMGWGYADETAHYIEDFKIHINLLKKGLKPKI